MSPIAIRLNAAFREFSVPQAWHEPCNDTGGCLNRAAVYRFDSWVSTFVNLAYLVLGLAVWRALYGESAEVGGITWAEMKSYTWACQMLIGIYSAMNEVRPTIVQKVQSGEVVMDLYKSLDFPWQVLAAALGRVAWNASTRTVPSYIVISVILKVPLPSPGRLVAFLAAMALGLVIQYALEFSIGSITFWTIEISGFSPLIMTFVWVLSGSIIPFDFLPEAMTSIAEVLPFRGLYYDPATIFTGQKAPGTVVPVLLRQAIWAGLALVWVRFVWNRATRKLVVQGG